MVIESVRQRIRRVQKESKQVHSVDTKTVRLKNSFLFGFIALLLCGVGDWLIGYEPKGGEPLMFGVSNTSIAQVPTWFYVLSLAFYFVVKKDRKITN